MYYSELLIPLVILVVLAVGGIVSIPIAISLSQDKKAQANRNRIFNKHFHDFNGSFALVEKNKANKKDIKSANKNLNLLWKLLKEIEKYADNQLPIIDIQIKSLMEFLVDEKTKKMGIDNINMKGSKIDLVALRWAKIKTIHDLIHYPHPYSYIYGIGERSEQKIINNLKIIKEQLMSSSKIRLSTDDKNPRASKLVLEVAKFIDSLPLSDTANKLLKLKPAFDDLSERIKKALRGFDKQKALIEAQNYFDTLVLLYKNNFENINETLFVPFEKLFYKSESEAWSDFSKNPIAFNKVIEQRVALIRGYSIGEYGLSSDVALKVKATNLNLEGFKLGLRTYQEWGTKYIICQKRTILGDEMGLGKTPQAIAAMVHLSNNQHKYFMVVCPLSVLTNWCRETSKFSSLPYYRIYGQGRNYWFNKWINEGGVAITTYETLNSLDLDSITSIDLLAVDEAHLIKNAAAIRTRNTKRLIRKSYRTVLLTGTVLENKVSEMINLIGCLNKNLAEELSNNVSKLNPVEYKTKISPVYFRRKRIDVLDELPEKIEVEEWCDLNQTEFDEYKKSILAKRFVDARRVSWNVDNNESSKMEKLSNIVEMAKEDNRKVLVFSFFLDTVKKIKDKFGTSAYGPIDGSVPQNDRQKIIDDFDNAPEGSVLVCQITSGGLGLNIQSASVVVICEPQFKPSTENQAISRSYRMGQARKVLVYHLLATNTIDERLNEILSAKQKEFDTYADDSLVAQQSFQIDSGMFAGIMQKEYDRLINDESDSQIIVDSTEEDDLPDIDLYPKSKGLSVTRRIDEVSQPKGGFINKKIIETIQLDDGVTLNSVENVNPGLVGTAVDYLTRFMNGTSLDDAFNISLYGATYVNESEKAKRLLKKINKDLDDDSVISAIKLCGYDVAFRSSPEYYKSVDEINPDKDTIDNVRTMVNRSLKFFEKYGPVVVDGFTFEGGYTDTISSGDGDYLTKDTLWDFKVSKYSPTNKNTLQLLIYYLMGQHSIHRYFKSITKLGIFNPRLNSVYQINVESIEKETIDEIEKEIIGYSK